MSSSPLSQDISIVVVCPCIKDRQILSSFKNSSNLALQSKVHLSTSEIQVIDWFEGNASQHIFLRPQYGVVLNHVGHHAKPFRIEIKSDSRPRNACGNFSINQFPILKTMIEDLLYFFPLSDVYLMALNITLHTYGNGKLELLATNVYQHCRGRRSG